MGRYGKGKYILKQGDEDRLGMWWGRRVMGRVSVKKVIKRHRHS